MGANTMPVVLLVIQVKQPQVDPDVLLPYYSLVSTVSSTTLNDYYDLVCSLFQPSNFPNLAA